MDLIKEDIHSAEYQERMQSNLDDLHNRFEELQTARQQECLRISNPRVVVCHCMKCEVARD